jgi:hypothetical protein
MNQAFISLALLNPVKQLGLTAQLNLNTPQATRIHGLFASQTVEHYITPL